MNITRIVLTIAIVAGFQTLHAQEYKVAKSTGRLELHLGKVVVEGYDGKEIIFSSETPDGEKDSRAEGLRVLNNLGLDDNTGLGIHVAEKGNVIEVHQLVQMRLPEIRIRVPKGIIISFSHDSQFAGVARFENLSNEIEVSAEYNSIELDRVTGPLTVQTSFGSVTASLDMPIKDPISIVSIYGFIDLAIPQDTKANLKLATSYGDIYVAPEFKINPTTIETPEPYGGKLSGTLNGGGVKLDLGCNYGKIYLRKK